MTELILKVLETRAFTVGKWIRKYEMGDGGEEPHAAGLKSEE